MEQNTGASRIFQNQDVLPIILSFFDPDAFYGNIWDIEGGTRSNLRMAALTSKAFFGPAISLLWRMLDSVMPLLKLISTFVSVNDIYTINGTFTAEDQETLDLYAKHIKYLCLKNCREVIRGHVIHRLSNLDTPLFPNLQSIYIPSLEHSLPRTTETMNIIFLAFSKSLTTLSINSINVLTEDAVASYLSVLDKKKAHLQDIDLGGRLTHNTLSLLNRFSHLKFLNLNLESANLTSFALRSWSSFTLLTHLVIHFDTSSTFESDDQGDNMTGNAANFQALQELRLGGLSAEVLKLLQSIGSSKTLASIMLGMASRPWPTEPVSASSTILTDCITECVRIAKSLKILRIRMADGLGRTIVLSDRPILCLSSCQQLRRIDISGVCLAANDNTIREVCVNKSWNNLRILRLPNAVDGNSPSLLSLNIIARNCPSLVELKICVDLRLHNYESLQSERTGPRMLHNLQRLFLVKLPNDVGIRNSVDTNTMKMAIGVSRFLEYHFPYLKTIELISNSSADADWWKGVLALMSEFQAIRAEMLSEQDIDSDEE